MKSLRSVRSRIVPSVRVFSSSIGNGYQVDRCNRFLTIEFSKITEFRADLSVFRFFTFTDHVMRFQAFDI